MKNMKISKKQIFSFLAIIVLSVIVGVPGISRLNSMSNAAERMYSGMGVPLGDLGLATEYFQRIRVQIRNIIIYTGDGEHLQAAKTGLTNRMEEYNCVMKPGVAALPDKMASRPVTLKKLAC